MTFVVRIIGAKLKNVMCCRVVIPRCGDSIFFPFRFCFFYYYLVIESTTQFLWCFLYLWKSNTATFRQQYYLQRSVLDGHCSNIGCYLSSQCECQMDAFS